MPSRKISLDDILAAVENDRDAGFCTACGAQVEGVEPDARGYRCDECGEPKVYGAEELLITYAS